jgi:hypothetical protein
LNIKYGNNRKIFKEFDFSGKTHETGSEKPEVAALVDSRRPVHQISEARL